MFVFAKEIRKFGNNIRSFFKSCFFEEKENRKNCRYSNQVGTLRQSVGPVMAFLAPPCGNYYPKTRCTKRPIEHLLCGPRLGMGQAQILPLPL